MESGMGDFQRALDFDFQRALQQQQIWANVSGESKPAFTADTEYDEVRSAGSSPGFFHFPYFPETGSSLFPAVPPFCGQAAQHDSETDYWDCGNPLGTRRTLPGGSATGVLGETLSMVEVERAIPP